MFVGKINTRGVLLACAMAAFSALTTTAKATAVGTNLSVVRIGFSFTSTTLAFVDFDSSLGFNSCTIPPGAPGARRLFFDFTTTRGKALMSLLTAAQLSGKRVSVTGNNVYITQQVLPFEPSTVAESLNGLTAE